MAVAKVKVKGYTHLVRDLKSQAIINTDSDAYARYMARKAKQAEKEDELRGVVREIKNLLKGIKDGRYINSNNRYISNFQTRV